jgi:hypothetical protein
VRIKTTFGEVAEWAIGATAVKAPAVIAIAQRTNSDRWYRTIRAILGFGWTGGYALGRTLRNCFGQTR